MTEYDEGAAVAGRFIILERIGEGGMGAVYRALQQSLDREVALKVLHSEVAFTPRARRRFGREARAVARLNHPHIAAVYDFGTDDDERSLWLAMELVNGSALTTLKRTEIDLLRLLSITDQILSALSAAHARAIIHRDLKPSNVLITADDEGREVIKLVDFGLAATQEGELSLQNAPGGLDDEEGEAQSRVIMGTPRYMAPEIFRRKPVDPRVDLYALGVILFEILAGKPPYPGDDPRLVMKGHLKEPIPQLHVRDGAEIPSEFEAIIYKLLAKDPDERYQTANEVREEIQTIIGNYSFVPWMQGPAFGDISQFSRGNMSGASFLSRFGGQTMPPAAMLGASRPGIQSSLAPLVGRQAERRLMEERIRRCVAQREPCLVTIEGEGGIGKSRLAQWIQVRVDEAGIMRSALGADSQNGGGFDGVRSIIDQILGTSEVPYDEVPYVIESRLTKWDFSPEEIDTVSRLMQPGGDAMLFNISGPVQDRISQQERVFAAVERVFRRASNERALLLILENLHHAGETTFAFIEHLVVGLHLNPDPIMLVATINSENLLGVTELKDSLGRISRFGGELLRIQLGILDNDEATELVQKILPLDEPLARRVARRAGGNPLHITQIVKYLQESEKLRFEEGKWRLQADVELDREVPQELGDLMRYRVERVASRHPDPVRLKALLDRCAIIGARFDYRLLRNFALAEADQRVIKNLDADLEYLVRDSVFREVGHSGEDILEFNHSLMRDVLLHDMDGKRSQRGLHILAAETKIQFFGNRAAQHGLEIAEHYRRARHPKGVYAFTLKAARAAMASSDLETAIRLFREAMLLAEKDASVEDEFGAEDQGLQEISAVMRSEEVMLEVAHIEVKIDEYEKAREHFRGLLRSPAKAVSAGARWGLGDLALRQGDLDEAYGWFEAALREASQIMEMSTRQTLEAQALFGKGHVHLLRGELQQAGQVLPSALELAQQEQVRRLEGDILRRLADVEWSLGAPEKAEIYRRRATMLAESLNDKEVLAESHMHTATYLRRIGQPGRVEEHTQAAIKIYEELGKRHAQAEGFLMLGRLAWARGDFKEAANKYREAHRLYEAFEDRRGTTLCKHRLAELAFSIQKHKETQALVRDAAEGYRSIGDRVGAAFCRLLAGRVELELQNVQQASSTFRSVVETFDEMGHVAGKIQALALLALAQEMLAEHTEVDEILRQVFETVSQVPISQESFATALERLSVLVNPRDPAVALDLDNLAEEAWAMLGRT